MDNLIVLSCNPGAKEGDYLTGTLWSMFYPMFKDVAKFAAVDSIVSLLNDDGNGAIVVYPEEMHRVKGFDVKATFEMFHPEKAKGLPRMEKHTESLKIAIQRVFPKYDRIFIALNGEVYKMCMMAALKETGWDRRVRFYDQLAAAWDRTKISKLLVTDLEKKEFRGGIVRVLERSDIEQKYIDRWNEFRKHVPERWRYWDWTDLYQDYNGGPL
jgi:hypothetical protein